jgi:drug/metabolite transporter (DMT)-like permease
MNQNQRQDQYSIKSSGSLRGPIDRRPSLSQLYLIEAGIQMIWGLTPSASRLILNYWPVEAYAALRFTLSSLLFLGVALWQQPSLRVRRRDITAMGLLGILTYGLSSIGLLTALQRGGVITFALASSANAMITAVISVLCLRERWSSGLTMAIALSVVGSLLLVWGKYDLSSASIAWGSVGLVWLAYAGEAFGFVFSRRYQRRYPLALYCGILQGSGAIFLWMVSAAGHRLPTSFTGPPLVWEALAFVCLFSCGLCYGVHYWLLRFIDGHRLAFFDCFHTVAAALTGFLLFRENLNIAMLAGGGLLIGAVWAVNRRSGAR